MARTPKSLPPPGRAPPTCAPCQLATRHPPFGSELRSPHAPYTVFTVQSNEIETSRFVPRFHVMTWVGGSYRKSDPCWNTTMFEPTLACATIWSMLSVG